MLTGFSRQVCVLFNAQVMRSCKHTHTSAQAQEGQGCLATSLGRCLWYRAWISTNTQTHTQRWNLIQVDAWNLAGEKKEEKLNHVMEFFCFIRSCEIMSGNVLIFKNSDIDRHRGINDTQFNNLNILRNLMARLCFSFQALFFFFFF